MSPGSSRMAKTLVMFGLWVLYAVWTSAIHTINAWLPGHVGVSASAAAIGIGHLDRPRAQPWEIASTGPRYAVVRVTTGVLWFPFIVRDGAITFYYMPSWPIGAMLVLLCGRSIYLRQREIRTMCRHCGYLLMPAIENSDQSSRCPECGGALRAPKDVPKSGNLPDDKSRRTNMLP